MGGNMSRLTRAADVAAATATTLILGLTSAAPTLATRPAFEPVARELARTGALTAGESDRLLDDLHERASTGRYLLARTYYSVIATVGTVTSTV